MPTATSDPSTPVTSRLRPEECLFIVFLTALIVLVAVTDQVRIVEHRLIAGLRFIAVVAGLGLVIFIRAYYRSGKRPERAGARAKARQSASIAVRAIRGFSPLFFCLAVYEALHDLTPVICKRVYDQWLIDSDHFVFHVDVSRWLDDHIGSPLVTQVLTYCYVSYAFASPGYAAYQYIRGNYRQFHDFALAIAITAFIGYTGYLLLPAVGPYVFQPDLYPNPLQAWGHGGLLNAMAKLKGSARDAFPSLHTAMTTVVLGLMWRDARRWFWTYLPIALGLYLATMYLRVHYATDVAAGFAVGGLALFAAPKINRWWYGWGRHGAARPGDASEAARASGAGVPRSRQADDAEVAAV